MSRYLNLESFYEAYDTSKAAGCSLLKLCTSCKNKKIKEEEANDLFLFCNKLKPFFGSNQMEGYFYNYTPEKGLSEEFDLIRFSPDMIINIELKSAIPKKGLKKVRDQLLNHYYVLSTLGKEIKLFTFISDEMILYSLDNNKELKETSFDELVKSISQEYIEYNCLDEMDLEELIISPYSRPELFINHSYHLSSTQIEVENNILKSNKNIIVIKGKAGTGKSLLLFDLARKYHDKGKKVILIFAAKLENLEELRSTYPFEIIHSFDLKKFNCYESALEQIKELSKYDCILIDEAHRLYKEPYEMILGNLKDKKLIFSVDHNQTMHKREISENIEEKLCNNLKSEVFELAKQVRMNKELEIFTKKLCKINEKKLQRTKFNNIRLLFYSNIKSINIFIESYLQEARKTGESVTVFEVNEYNTKNHHTLMRENVSKYSVSVNKRIGQEYDTVIMILDKYHYYNKNGDLDSMYTDNYPFNENRVIYQALTRAKKKIILIVYNNPDLFIKINEKIMLWYTDD